MKIGLIADTHDNMPVVERAVRLFNERGARMVLHAGDYIAPFALEPFKELKGMWVGVLGQNDGDTRGLIRASQGRIHHSPFTLTFHGWRILIVHRLSPAVDTVSHNLVVHGYSHTPETAQSEGTLIVNPGECCGWLTGRRTVAVVDIDANAVEVVDLD